MNEEGYSVKAKRLGNGVGDSLGLSLCYDATKEINKYILEQLNIFEIKKDDRAVLRELAKNIKEAANRTVEEEKKKLWYKHNELKPCRPLVFCDPENGWYEIITPDQLKSKSTLARIWEFKLRKELFWADQMGDDRATSPYFKIQYVYKQTDRGAPTKLIGANEDGSYTWEPSIKDYSQIDELEYARLNIDYEKTSKLVELAEEILGDYLVIQLEGCWWWSFGMTEDVIYFIGMEKFFLDMYDNPEGLHKLMSFLKDENIAKFDFLERNKLFTLNNENTYVGSGGFGFTNELPSAGFDSGNIKTQDLWGFADSQETTNVSPQMFEEFVFTYQMPLLKRFGLNCYGCCEPLNDRWDLIKNIPNLRRVSVSPWAIEADMAEKLGKDYIYSRKVNPLVVALPRIDEENARKDIRNTLQYSDRCNIELIMKDTHTIGRNPKNVISWCKIAMEEVMQV